MDKDLMKLLTIEGRPSKSQRAIARYIIENSQAASFMTAQMLAKAAGVSESSVVRYARQLGFEGYTQLRRSLQELVKERLAELDEIRHSGGQDALHRTVERSMKDIQSLTGPQNGWGLEQGAQALATARGIVLLSALGVEGMELYLERSLEALGLDARWIELGDARGLDRLKEGWILFLLGSGDSKCLKGPARLARSRGAAVMLLRGQPEEELDKLAQIVLEAQGMVATAVLAEALLETLEELLGRTRRERREELRQRRRELYAYELDEN